MLSKRIALAAKLLRGKSTKVVLASLHVSILKNTNKPEFMAKLKNRIAVDDCLYLFVQEKMILEVFEVLTVIANKFPMYIRFRHLRDRLMQAYIENSDAQGLLVGKCKSGRKGVGALSQVDQDFVSNCIYLDCLSDSIDPIVIEQLQSYLKAP